MAFIVVERVLLAALVSSLGAAVGAVETNKTSQAARACPGLASELSTERRKGYEALATGLVSDAFYRALIKHFGAPQSCTRGGGDDEGLSLIYSFTGGKLTARVQPDIEFFERRLDWRGLNERDAERLLRAEEKAASSQGCGIAWRSPETEKSPDGVSRTVTYRGRICNCQVGRVYEGTVLTTLFFRSAC